MEEHVLSGKPRSEFGSRAAQRLRAGGLLPVNIYGHGEGNLSIVLPERDFRRFFEAGHRVATIHVEGQGDEHGVIKEVQYDSMGSDLLHVDFSRIDPHEKIAMEVRIELVGVPKGAAQGGSVEQPLHELRVEGPANKVPEVFPLVVSELGLGESIRLKDVAAPDGCAILGDPEQVVVAVNEPKEEPEGDVAAAPTASEPEVIGEKKDDSGDS